MFSFSRFLCGRRLSMALVLATLLSGAVVRAGELRDSFFGGSSRPDLRDGSVSIDASPRRRPRESFRVLSAEELLGDVHDVFDREEPGDRFQDRRVPVLRGSDERDIPTPTFRDDGDRRWKSLGRDRIEDRQDFDQAGFERDDSLKDWQVIDSFGASGHSDRWPQTEIRRRVPQSDGEFRRVPERPATDSRPVDERPSIQESLTTRYTDAAILRFVSSLPAQQGLALYGEVLTYVTERHLQPPNSAAMAQRGLYNLSQGLQNPAFLQATRLNVSGMNSQALPRVLAQMSQQQVSRNEDAVALLRETIAATQQYGLPPSVVTLEFIHGALDGLDRFSAFLPDETARSQSQQLGESMVGIGVTIEKADGGIKVIKTISGSPAAQAGLQKGDRLVSINGRSLQGLKLDGALSMIAGPEGSVAVVGLERGGRQAQVSIVRRRIETHSVTDVQMADRAAGIGYLKVEIFGAKSKSEMDAALQSLHQQGMQAVVVDLRGNPGGLLTAAIELSDMFLPQGTIVSTRGRTPSDDSDTQAQREKTWKVPLVLLVDGNSASASEIMAAAIQDNGRGVLVGRHTYGKGTVQTLFPMKSASCSLRLTTARFYSPSGKPMAGAGVEPDVASEEGTDSQGRERDVLAGINAARQLLNR